MKHYYLFFLILLINTANAQITLNSFEASEAAPSGLFGYRMDAYENQIICNSRNPNALLSNTAHIFERNGFEMTQTATLEQTDPTANDGYGRGLAIFGDFAAVTAPFDDTFSPDSGCVYVYHKSGNIWSLLQKVTAPDLSQVNSFGSGISIYNNQLFVFGNPNSAQSAVYIYNLEANDVLFAQLLTSANKINLGSSMAFEGNTFVTTYRNPNENMTQHIDTYNFVDGQWAHQNNFQIESDISTGIFQIRLDNGQLFVSTGSISLNAVTTITTYNFTANNWIFDNSFVIDPLQTVSEKYTDFDISGNDMIVGMAARDILIGAKSPSIHYKKIEGEWVIQEIFYGHQTQNTDDRFGSQIKFAGDMFIINAPQDSSINEFQGKVYFADNAILKIKENTFNDWAVYPNPTNNNIYFKMNDVAEKVEIFSTTGNLLHTELNTKNVSLENFLSGMYLVKLTSANDSQTFKILKN